MGVDAEPLSLHEPADPLAGSENQDLNGYLSDCNRPL